MQVSQLIPVYEEGTWNPAFTGFSSGPSVSECKFTKNGRLVTDNIRLTSGTSNATTFTMTLSHAGGALSQVLLVMVINNGIQVAGRVDVGANSAVATFYTSAAAAAFTGSGSKGTNCSISYQSAS